MNTNELDSMSSRLSRLERQNRLLICAVCILAGLGSIAATRNEAKIIDADEIRAQRITLVDLQGKICWYHQGSDGTVIEGGPITDYPPLTPRPSANVISKWKHFSLFP